MQKQTCLLLLLLAVAACSVVPAQQRAHPLVWSTETVIATPRVLRLTDDSSARTAQFVRPVSIRANERAIVVADVGDDRILILDSAGDVRRTFGVRGRGPGELLGVSHISLRANSVLIGEAHNGRVSEFALDGRFIGIRAAGFAAGAISANSRDVFTASRSSDYYAALITIGNPPVDALRRPADHRSGEPNRWSRVPGHDLIVSDSTRTWVFDQGGGALCEYNAPEARPNCYGLPEKILGRLLRYRADRVAQLESAIRMRVEAAPLAKDLIFTGRYLALLLPLPDIPVLLIDPTDATLTPVMTLGASLPAWALSARSFAWDGSGFLLIGDDGLGRLDVSNLKSALR